MKRLEVVHTFVPHRKEDDLNLPPNEPPITKMFTSSDGQWLAAINCFGDIYIFNLETRRSEMQLAITCLVFLHSSLANRVLHRFCS